MIKRLIQGMMVNLEMWIETEPSSAFRNLYIDYYEMLNEKRKNL